MAHSAFTLAYQPIVTLTSGELAGFEALVRWPHPQWGMMQPDQFIALAEETGQIVPLGSWVLARAAADLARWRQAAARALRQRERVGPPVQRARLRRRRAPRSSTRVGSRARGAHARADRERAAAPRRAGARRPDGAEGHRRAAGHRRLRHRLLLPQLPAGAADRRAEDGQVLRGRDRRLRAAPGSGRGHRPDRPDAPARGHRRGDRERGPAGPADLHGLPVRAGLPAGDADAGQPGGDARPDRVPPGAQPPAPGPGGPAECLTAHQGRIASARRSVQERGRRPIEWHRTTT